MGMDISRKEREVLKLPGLVGTWEILAYLCGHDTGSYRHFRPYISDSTLNKRLNQLLRSGLIEHHLTREESKKEWYEITKRGRKFTKLMIAQLKLFDTNDNIKKSMKK